MTARPRTTEADLLPTQKDDRKYEPVDVPASPGGGRPGIVIVELVAQLPAFVKQARSGYVLGSRTGFGQRRRNVRSPDLSLVAQRRLKSASPEALGGSSPDVTFEIL